ncbi:unannotated protein [freshwater metagenome]|uniref:Unannotated protein n=1 Tax=freshwater metagenome TaxID=449393 RepID=A0A6J7PDV0_9ZZZZ
MGIPFVAPSLCCGDLSLFRARELLLRTNERIPHSAREAGHSGLRSEACTRRHEGASAACCHRRRGSGTGCNLTDSKERLAKRCCRSCPETATAIEVVRPDSTLHRQTHLPPALVRDGFGPGLRAAGQGGLKRHAPLTVDPRARLRIRLSNQWWTRPIIVLQRIHWVVQALSEPRIWDLVHLVHLVYPHPVRVIPALGTSTADSVLDRHLCRWHDFSNPLHLLRGLVRVWHEALPGHVALPGIGRSLLASIRQDLNLLHLLLVDVRFALTSMLAPRASRADSLVRRRVERRSVAPRVGVQIPVVVRAPVASFIAVERAAVAIDHRAPAPPAFFTSQVRGEKAHRPIMSLDARLITASHRLKSQFPQGLPREQSSTPPTHESGGRHRVWDPS